MPATELSFADFAHHYGQYAAAEHLDEVRARDFSQLDRLGQVYLDYTGSALAGRYQLDRYRDYVCDGIWGNPHSLNSPSRRSTEEITAARRAVLDFLNGTPDEYTVVFCANASAAIRLVAESFPFTTSSRLGILQDNHNSVLGMREYAARLGAEVTTVPLGPDLRADAAETTRVLAGGADGPSLFAYPAQSNFSGVRHSLDWIDVAHAHGWRVLLDAAALVLSQDLDLSEHKPDFVPLSFYKIFGWPTGIGCLVARKEALAELRRPWFSGGTVIASSAMGGWHALAPGAEGFEDGTPNFLGAVGVSIGLDYVANVVERAPARARMTSLLQYALNRLTELKHDNGMPMCVVYGPRDVVDRGPTIAFNIMDSNGHVVDERLAESRAVAMNIALRTGCFCNPGVGERAFDLDEDDLIRAGRLSDGQYSVDHYRHAVGVPTGGALRISLGPVSNFQDLSRFDSFMLSWQNFVQTTETLAGLPPRERC
ncbi:aminotransferase class V-fold PLP-dependent enzyme [Streptomyces sp. NBC_00445]|uniref:aminotransferase class V-fold PLP-dependent enzyme n=1 Tax=Streptomyces sp. NBC_00445 TaxID=2975745 RepID=UPI002E21F4E1